MVSRLLISMHSVMESPAAALRAMYEGSAELAIACSGRVTPSQTDWGMMRPCGFSDVHRRPSLMKLRQPPKNNSTAANADPLTD